jgi:hypothetical protein
MLNTALDYLDANPLTPRAGNPITAATADITLALSDAGKLIYVISDEDDYTQQFIVPPNAVVAFPIGTVITFATVNARIEMREEEDDGGATRSNIYGEGYGTSSNYMGFTGTGVTRLIKIATNDWIFAGNNIWYD